MKEDLKRRIWTVALSVLIFFLCFPVVSAINLGHYKSDISTEQIARLITEFMGPQYVLGTFITIAGAIICGLSGFFYLHSRKKADFYHSIPVRRETLFTVSFLNGILIYLVPYIINVLLSVLVLQINHFMSMDIFKSVLSAILINLIYYCFIYTIVVIAVMLTGNFIISCFGAAVFLLYGPLLAMLKEMYYSQFYNTYYTSGGRSNSFIFLSPIGSYTDAIYKTGNVINSDIIGKLLGIFVITIVLIAFAMFLYKKRQSEAAGKAMAFKISEVVIKFLLVIPLTMGGGTIFRETAGYNSDGWFIFGLIFSFIIIYGTIEIIYNFDIRSAFRHKRQFVIIGFIIAASAGIFRFDLLGYDSYIPKDNKIKSMSVSVSGLDENLQYADTESSYINRNDYQLKHMELNNFKTAYTLAELGVKQQAVADDLKRYQYNIKYTLKSGREVYRVYNLNISGSFDMLEEIFADTAYKAAHYPIFQWEAESLSNFYCYNLLGGKSISLDDNEKLQLLERYKEDLNNFTLSEMAQDQPIANLSFELNSERVMEYYIYPTYEKTITFLTEHGFDAAKEVDYKNIKNIFIRNNQTSDNKVILTDTGEIYDPSASERIITANYIDKDKINGIYPYLVSQDYYQNNRTILNADINLDVTVTIRTDDFGNEESYSYFFQKDRIPEFIKQDLKYLVE